MQHVLGMFLDGNPNEVFDNDAPGAEPYAFMGLIEAMEEAKKRFSQRPDISQINFYEVFDGVRRTSLSGRYQLVHSMLREGATDRNQR